MSILINMEMPTSCHDCEIGGAKQLDKAGNCPFYRLEWWEQEEYRDRRVDGCPLVPVPPHGRLIDADALMRHKGDCYDADGHLLYAVGTGNILCAPTIIPAELAEEGET